MRTGEGAGQREFREVLPTASRGTVPTNVPPRSAAPGTLTIASLSAEEKSKIGRLVERLVQATDSAQRAADENTRLKTAHVESLAHIQENALEVQHENDGAFTVRRQRAAASAHRASRTSHLGVLTRDCSPLRPRASRHPTHRAPSHSTELPSLLQSCATSLHRRSTC